MRKKLLIAAVSALSISVALPANAVQGATLDQRVKRLERMLENPVLLQLSRRLGEQQREIQNLQDKNDRLIRELNQIKGLMDKRYQENDERLSALEGGAVKPAQNKTPVIEAPLNTKQSTLPIDTAGSAAAAVASSSTESQMASTATETALPNQPSRLDEMPRAVEKSQASVAVPIEQNDGQNAEPPVVKQAPTLETSSTPKPITIRDATEGEKQAYKTAFNLMQASKYDQAIQAFQQFLTRYPQSELASNAAYWSGEGYLIKEQNKKALEAFMTVIQRYPSSSKVPDAKLRAGDSYDRLGESQKAKTLYLEVIKTRPHSRAAKNAKKRLENG